MLISGESRGALALSVSDWGSDWCDDEVRIDRIMNKSNIDFSLNGVVSCEKLFGVFLGLSSEYGVKKGVEEGIRWWEGFFGGRAVGFFIELEGWVKWI